MDGAHEQASIRATLSKSVRCGNLKWNFSWDGVVDEANTKSLELVSTGKMFLINAAIELQKTVQILF
jgi:hypothetical protein